MFAIVSLSVSGSPESSALLDVTVFLHCVMYGTPATCQTLDWEQNGT